MNERVTRALEVLYPSGIQARDIERVLAFCAWAEKAIEAQAETEAPTNGTKPIIAIGDTASERITNALRIGGTVASIAKVSDATVENVRNIIKRLRIQGRKLRMIGDGRRGKPAMYRLVG